MFADFLTNRIRLGPDVRGITMFCAKCGSEAVENQKFCRSCGNRLQSVLPVPDQAPRVSRNGKNAVARAANEIGMMGALTLAAMLALTIISLLISSIIHTKLPEVIGHIFQASIYVALIVITIGVFLKIVGWFMDPEPDDSQQRQAGYAETSQTNRLIESPAPISSVAEHTTRSLEDRVAESAYNSDSDSARLFTKSGSQ
jgi:zinc ribbon protein